MRSPTLIALTALALTALAACQDSDVSRAVGARCERSSDCDDRCLGPSGDWPGGFCTLDCDSDSDCPPDARCVREDDSGICAYACFTDPGCVFLGNGYTCKERDSVRDAAIKVTVCRG
jgi:hypothetical protein